MPVHISSKPLLYLENNPVLHNAVYFGVPIWCTVKFLSPRQYPLCKPALIQKIQQLESGRFNCMGVNRNQGFALVILI
jgi:hypothetical protein